MPQKVINEAVLYHSSCLEHSTQISLLQLCMCVIAKDRISREPFCLGGNHTQGLPTDKTLVATSLKRGGGGGGGGNAFNAPLAMDLRF